MLVPWLGLDWQLLWLRIPSVLYTLANTALVVWAARSLGQDVTQRQNSIVLPKVLTPNTLGFLAGLIFWVASVRTATADHI